jgi:hypothetical protein
MAHLDLLLLGAMEARLDGERLGLGDDNVRALLAHLVAEAERPQRRKALAPYRSSFLQDLSLGDSVSFEEWATVRREQLHRRAVGAQQGLAAYHERRGEPERGLSYAWSELNLDPWREDAQRQLIRLLALSGQRRAVLAQYEACGRALAVEPGVEPEQETVALVESMRRGAPTMLQYRGARCWKLRATAGPARLWQRQAKAAQAHGALAAIYGWFTEGFDTPDLVEAKELLEQLSGDQASQVAGR